MKLPELGATTAQRAWLLGCGGALVLMWIGALSSVAFAALPLTVIVLAVYALTVRPRAFAASGVLFGTLPLLTWGSVGGLMNCASVNRTGGSCEADPSAQIAVALGTYSATVVVTLIALGRPTTS